jgi:hypothetical protein
LPVDRPARRLAFCLGAALLGVALLATASWGVLALYFFDHAGAGLRTALASAFALGCVAVLAGLTQPRWRRRAMATYAVLFAAVVIGYCAIQPSNERDWPPETALLPYAVIDGDRVTLHNIRNFDYRTETDFTPAYYDKTFDLRQLTGVDLGAVYWMGPRIAHLFASFEFNGTDHVAISIEARRARGEAYSSLQGFFRRFELIYVVGDERDVIGLRTNYRQDPPEQVYLYRLRGQPGSGTRLFLEYLRKINELRAHPEFYNSLTTNCAGSIWMLSRVNPDHPPYSWKILLSGYAPEFLYEEGRLDTGIPFAELERRSHINSRARAAGASADFSQRIRAPLPPSARDDAP